MICFCRYLNYTGTVIGEVIEHLLFLRGEVEKYAKIGTRAQIALDYEMTR
jgi:hypothetical protein